MEAKIGGENKFCSSVMSGMKAVGKRSLEWDLDDWRWDGDLLLATPLNPRPSDCRNRELFPVGPEIASNGNASNSSSSSSENNIVVIEKGNSEREKRRRAAVFPEEEVNGEAGPINLKLGEQVYPIIGVEVDMPEGKDGKKGKHIGTTSNRPVCQVEDCMFDLRNAKDYHRRHKVCEMHAKASEALVANVMQRFCQQCSRFHVLQEFDEGKRSCRRRLAGHNKRRRKAQPDPPANVGSLTDEKSAGYLLISLLKILSNLHSNGSDQSKDQDLLSHLLKNLAGPLNASNISGLVQGSQSLLDVGTSSSVPEKEQRQPIMFSEEHRSISARGNLCQRQQNGPASQGRVVDQRGESMPAKENVQKSEVERQMLNGLDLNNVYNDPQEYVADQEKGNAPVPFPFWHGQELRNSSPPQRSGNTESTSGRSSSSGSDTQSRTDRIVFKLFGGKDPNDLPQFLRTQILDWLSHSPTDIEGYIRPGCIVLTIYLRLNKSLWEELSYDMSSSLSALLDVADAPFWKTGWIYTRMQQHAALIYNGQVVLDTPLPFQSHRSRISHVSPIAVPAAETVQLIVRGSNLSRPNSRLLCAIEGKYLVQENCSTLVEADDFVAEQDKMQSLSFHCSVPDVIGRGFIEVEDHGLTGCFFPFIVAEAEICSEICMLEEVMDVADEDDCVQFDGEYSQNENKNQAVEFIYEMGWLLHRSHLRSKMGELYSHLDPFPFERLKWLVNFSVDRDWCAVLRKLLDLLFTGAIDSAGHVSVEDAVLDLSLLHTAVRRNSRPLVEFLLKYIPRKQSTSHQEKQLPPYGSSSIFFFRPDMAAAGGLTPLHIAACSEGLDNVLDALLEDPGMVGVEAWRKAADSTGLTPNDYASLRGHYAYIQLVQRKVSEKSSGKHTVVDISSLSGQTNVQKQMHNLKSAKVGSFYTEKLQLRTSCKLCRVKPDIMLRRAPLASRPAILSLVAIAAVCVCAALLFRGLPKVCYIFGPFRWETLKYGAL